MSTKFKGSLLQCSRSNLLSAITRAADVKRCKLENGIGRSRETREQNAELPSFPSRALHFPLPGSPRLPLFIVCLLHKLFQSLNINSGTNFRFIASDPKTPQCDEGRVAPTETTHRHAWDWINLDGGSVCIRTAVTRTWQICLGT